MLRTLALGFWWALIAGLTYLAVTQLSGCALDVEGSGELEPNKRPRDVDQVDAGELAPDAAVTRPDAAVTRPDAGMADRDATAGMRDAAALEPDSAPEMRDAAAPAALAGAWEVVLEREHGTGCTGRPVAGTERWEVAGDLGTLTTPAGVLYRLPAPPAVWWQTQGAQPVVRVELAPGSALRGQLLVEFANGCLETWTAEGKRL